MAGLLANRWEHRPRRWSWPEGGLPGGLSDGVVRRLAGQAVLIRVATVVERLPEAFKAERPGVPWREITAMRNLAAHRYERTDDGIVWRTLVADIPDLLRTLGISPADAG